MFTEVSPWLIRIPSLTIQSLVDLLNLRKFKDSLTPTLAVPATRSLEHIHHTSPVEILAFVSCITTLEFKGFAFPAITTEAPSKVPIAVCTQSVLLPRNKVKDYVQTIEKGPSVQHSVINIHLRKRPMQSTMKQI